jgi:hypothetical protein
MAEAGEQISDVIPHQKMVSDFKLERYKYILKQLHFLNDSLHKYLTLFQALATAIVSAAVTVFVSWKKLEISPEIAQLSIHILLALLFLVSLFVGLSVIAGIFSWIDYRREEVQLLNSVVGPGFRSAPTMRNIFRWYETYVVLFLLAVMVGATILVECKIIPLIH